MMKRKLIRIFLVLLLLLAVPLTGWRIHLSRFINRQLAEIRADGLPTNGEELNRWYPAAPDSQNAALALTRVFELRRNFPDSRSNLTFNFKLPGRAESLSKDQIEMLEDYVAMNTAMLTEADKALALPASRYPVDYGRLMNTPLPHLAKLSNLARLHEYAAFLAIRSGQLRGVSTNIVTMLALALTLENEPCYISQLVRLRLIRMAFTTLERRANAAALSATELTNLTKAFASARTTEFATRVLIGERAMIIPYFRMSRAEAARLKFRTDSDESPNDTPLPCHGPAILRLIGYYELEFGSYLAGVRKGIDFASVRPPGNLAANGYFSRVGEESAKRHRAISSRLLSYYASVVSHGNEAIALQHLAVTALAVEQFRNQDGRLPETLEELKPKPRSAEAGDPFTGQALRYRRTDKGYILYSVGRDGRDDGGLEESEKRESSDGKSHDLTITVER